MKPIQGSIVALVTPMHEDGSVDFAALRKLIDWHVAEGTDCISVVGTTGESPTVTVDEQKEIIRVTVEHVPGRTVADLQHETVLRLAQVPGIIGIKEATGNIDRAQWLIREAPAGFGVYSGDDPTAVALMLCGGQGNVSVTANVAPRLMHELCMAAVAGDAKGAMQLQRHLMPLHRNLFVEANPIPVKWALSRLGRCGGALRLPLTPLTPASQAKVEQALKDSGLL